MKAAIRNTEIYFDVAGMQLAPYKNKFVERPVLFMLHGGPGGDHLRFKQHSLELQNVAQLVFIDHRGCGQSKKTNKRDYTLLNNVEDIEALRKYLGLQKICVLGTSYGGIVAQKYAIRYGKHLQKLILVATSPSYRFIEAAKKLVRERGTPEQIAVCEPLWAGKFKNPEEVDHFFSVMEGLYSVIRKRKKKTHRSQTVWSHEALNAGFGGFLRNYDFVPQLKKIKCPTLVLAGAEDWICPPVFAKEIATHIPHAVLKIFRNCGHSVAMDAHDQYIHAIQRFLSRA